MKFDPAMPAALLVALALAGASASAADRPTSDRSTPGTTVPSTGTTAIQESADSARVHRPSGTDSATPGPVSSGDSVACAALRKQYAQSQACFSRYRLRNGGLKPQAFKQCREIENPSVKCGSAVVD